MGRPPSSDPKVVVTLRLRRSTLDAYKAGGDEWRARMEAMIEVGLLGPGPAPPYHGMSIVQAAKPAVALEKTAEPPPKPAATTPAPKVRKAAAEPQEAARERFTMDDVRPKFVPRLKNR